MHVHPPLPARPGASTRVRAALKNTTSRNYRTARLWGLLSAWKRTFGAQPVLVYQMGKVGSTAVEASLAAAGVEHVMKVHTLTEEGIARREDVHRRRWPHAGSGRHLFDAMWARRLVGRPDTTRWTVIALVREPVARNLSGFFEVGDTYHGIPFGEMMADAAAPGLALELQDEFLHRYDDHDTPASWFGDELHPVFGVDVYALPFPHGDGWQLFESDRARVAVIRMEDLERALPDATEALLGRRVDVVAANVGDDKDHAPLYRRLRDEIDLPRAYLDRMYGSGYAQHFFTRGELTRFRERWERVASSAAVE